MVIVNFESPNELDGCLSALEEAAHTGPLVVVDNSLTPGARQRTTDVTTNHRAKLIRPTGGNIGFAAGCNLGAADAGPCEYLLFVNPDARVAPRTIELLSDALGSDARLGAVNPVIRTASGAIWFSSGRLQRRLGRLVQESGEPRSARPVNPTDWVNGCVLLVRSSAFEQAGGFDESYFLYWEDVALSGSLEQHGWTIGVVAKAEAVHRKGLDLARTQAIEPAQIEHSVRGRLHYIRTELDRTEQLSALLYTPFNLIRLTQRGRHASGVIASARAALRGVRAAS